MKNILIAVACLLFLASVSCSSTKSSSVKQYQKDSLLVAIERGACFGACPEFKATLYKSGLAIYNGRRHVNLVGTYQARLSGSQMDSLLAYIRTEKVEDFDTTYVNPHLADFPAYFLWLSDTKPTKQILVSHEAPPEKVVGFTKRVEDLVNGLDWKKISDSVNQD
ncbi:MAG TPA: DUF6438 domain-containing protein [Bacteroidia bacterium]|jgi:hypothetical protein|nr:DUF6438 domain-containing protein [Bacteroidia bacterium]